MHINGLRLLGFKSFVEPTELLINHGLTGVVGPNGCGKSNLLEGLRWVMGETSYKTMRASSMDDVIFAGTDLRPARNMAEVTLILDNSARTAPAEFNHSDALEVTRRIERDAGSSYKINGRSVRAKDVQLLFADAATGARSPALVQQGQIGQIVNSKPQARRRILEEAAGITGLHSRRHEAELRLKAAESNMERLQDIMDQLSSRLATLKRQARQASRYKALSGEIKQAEAIVMYLQWQNAVDKVARQEHELQDILQQVGLLTQNEAAAVTAQTNTSEALQPLRDDEMTRAVVLQRLKIELETLEKEEQRAKQRLEELTSLVENLQNDLNREEHVQSEGQDSLKRLEDEDAQINKDQIQSADHEQTARQTFTQAKAQVEATEKQVSDLTQKIAENRTLYSQYQKTLETTKARMNELTKQNADIAQHHAELETVKSEQQKIETLKNSVVALSEHVADLQTKTLAAEQKHTDTQAIEKEKRETAQQIKLQARQLETEVHTLEKVLVSSSSEQWPPVVDKIQVQSGYEVALGAALGDDLDAAIDDTAPAYWRTLDDLLDEPLPELCTPLSQFVKAPVELARRLAQIGVIDTELGHSLQNQLKPGQRLVSIAGDIWRWDGYIAAADAPTAAAQRLKERNRLDELQQSVVEALQHARACDEEHQNALENVKNAQIQQQDTRNHWRNGQTELDRARDVLTKQERNVQDSLKKLAALEEAKARITHDLTYCEEQKREAEDALTKLGTTEPLQNQHEQLKAQLTDERDHLSKVQAELAGLERDAKLRANRKLKIAQEKDHWVKRIASAEEQISSLNQRLTKAKSDLVVLQEAPEPFSQRRDTLLSEISKAETARGQAADRLAEMENALRDTSKALKEAQDRVNAAKEDRARAETKLETARERLTEQASLIRETLECAPEEALKIADVEDSANLPDLQDTELKLQKLKKDRERLGGVNLQAEEEAAQLGQELQTMDTERTDLENAISRLRQGISNLNREGRKRLLDAFDVVNAHFKDLFTTLFDGGEAELKLVESDDPLEAGLEIIARPPGKKPQVLSLLSGGEKALTALSLIFAVFLTNPSPICVLDEVDAPLDDANVHRFCKLLESMVENTKTRFLVITHHPMTMARMNRLFGVTMSEKGVSQLVSVDLATAEGLREAS